MNGKPLTKAEKLSINLFKKESKQVIKDFHLKPDIERQLLSRIDEAKTAAEITRVLRDAREEL